MVSVWHRGLGVVLAQCVTGDGAGPGCLPVALAYLVEGNTRRVTHHRQAAFTFCWLALYPERSYFATLPMKGNQRKRYDNIKSNINHSGLLLFFCLTCCSIKSKIGLVSFLKVPYDRRLRFFLCSYAIPASYKIVSIICTGQFIKFHFKVFIARYNDDKASA